MQLIIAITAAAEKKRIQTVGTTGTLSIVGLVTTETVAVEIPRFESPDVATDAHWTAMKQDGDAVVLSADNNVVRIPANLVVRVNKAAGVSNNAYGVRWS